MTVERAGWNAAEDRHHLRETPTSDDRIRVSLDQSYANTEQNLTSFEEQTVPHPQHRLRRHTPAILPKYRDGTMFHVSHLSTKAFATQIGTVGYFY